MFYYFDFKGLSDKELNQAYAILNEANSFRPNDDEPNYELIKFNKQKELVNSLKKFGRFQKLIDDCNKYIHESMWYEVGSKITFSILAFTQEMAERFHQNYLDN